MSDASFATTIHFDSPLAEVFDAIIDPSAWWSDTIGGDASEVGAEVRFEIGPGVNGSRLRFTHDGLVPQFECFEACSRGWTGYIRKSLREPVLTGTGQQGRY